MLLVQGIRIKMAHKQFVGLSVPSDEQIYFVHGAVRFIGCRSEA